MRKDEKEIIIMTKWRKPDIKFFGLKMNENIAASGNDGYEIGLIGIHKGNGQDVYNQKLYRYTSDRRIQDTNVKYHFMGDGITKAVSHEKEHQIVGCLAE